MASCVARPSSNQKAKAMGNAYEIYALRYATMSPRTPHMNFLAPDPHEATAQDLNYFVWLIRGGGRDILVDTGCLIKRIQVKRAKFKLKQGGMNSRRDREHYWVDLTKHSRGHDHRRIPANSFDFLAAVCEPDLIYLIPHDKLIAEDGRMLRGIGIKMPTEGRLDSIKAGQRWEAYRNNIDSVVDDGR